MNTVFLIHPVCTHFADENSRESLYKDVSIENLNDQIAEHFKVISHTNDGDSQKEAQKNTCTSHKLPVFAAFCTEGDRFVVRMDNSFVHCMFLRP